MSSSDTHVFIDNVQECSYDELSNDHVVIFIDNFLTMFFAFYIIIPHIIKNQFYWLKDNHMT